MVAAGAKSGKVTEAGNDYRPFRNGAKYLSRFKTLNYCKYKAYVIEQLESLLLFHTEQKETKINDVSLHILRVSLIM